MGEVIQVELPAGGRERLEALAHEQGYDTSAAFLSAVVADMLEDDGVTEAELADEFREAWRAVKRNQIIDEDAFWKALAEDD
ncbi:MAG: hypothetical protein SF123_25065 [Chloroflexota bacterium]|nr:hypothetical protein [Chloroflexota bacterium]